MGPAKATTPLPLPLGGTRPGEACRAESAGRDLQGGADGAGRGLGDSDSPRTGLELPLLPSPASSRSQRFLTGDRDSAAMSAAEEVDGLGVVRPHYGCECPGAWGCADEGDQARLEPGGSVGRVREVARDRRDPEEQPGCVWQAGRQQGWRPSPLQLPRQPVRTRRPQPSLGRCGRGAPPSASAA